MTPDARPPAFRFWSPGSASLFAQALALVIATLVAAQLIAIAVVFTLPPPPPEFYRLSEITRALKTGQNVQPRDGRQLIVRPNVKAFRGLVDNRRRAEFKTAVGRVLGVDPKRIEIITDTGPRFFVRTQRLNRPPVERRADRSFAGVGASEQRQRARSERIEAQDQRQDEGEAAEDRHGLFRIFSESGRNSYY